LSTIGEILKKHRELNNLTLKQLANISGVGPSTISDIETGKAKNPRMDTLEKLAKALKIPVNIFFSDSNETCKEQKEHLNINNIEEFKTVDEAKTFILSQPSIMGYGGFNIDKLNNADILALANDLLSQYKYLMFKYNRKK